MVVNSVGAFAPRAVSRSQSFVQNRWNPYASGPAEPLLSGYGFGGPGPGYHPLNHPHPHHHHHPHHPSALHPLVAAADESHGHGMKFTSTAEEYGASAHGGGGGGGGSGVGGGYDYHPPPPPQPPPGPPAIIHQPLPPLWQAPAPGGKGKGKGAALSALTLLAFLYFLNLLQSCLKEHMETMNPTVMVMTAGANRRKYILDRVDSSVEQATGGSGEDEPPRDDESHGSEGSAAAAAAAAAYEQLSHRYQLLTSSNRTRNPFKRPTNRARNKSSAPSRYEWHTGSDDWFDRSGVDRRG